MLPILDIAVEWAWRAPMLDTVLPIAKFPLTRSENGLKTLHEECSITLTDGASLAIGCTLNQYGDIGFSLADQDAKVLKLSARQHFYLEIRTPDRKFYIFRSKDSNQVIQTTSSVI